MENKSIKDVAKMTDEELVAKTREMMELSKKSPVFDQILKTYHYTYDNVEDAYAVVKSVSENFHNNKDKTFVDFRNFKDYNNYVPLYVYFLQSASLLTKRIYDDIMFSFRFEALNPVNYDFLVKKELSGTITNNNLFYWEMATKALDLIRSKKEDLITHGEFLQFNDILKAKIDLRNYFAEYVHAMPVSMFTKDVNLISRLVNYVENCQVKYLVDEPIISLISVIYYCIRISGYNSEMASFIIQKNQANK